VEICNELLRVNLYGALVTVKQENVACEYMYIYIYWSSVSLPGFALCASFITYLQPLQVTNLWVKDTGMNLG
jgi:hypothetical protein